MLRQLALPIFLPSACVALGQQAGVILLPLYMLDAGYSPAFAAFAFAFRGLGTLLVNVPAGLLVGRWGERPVMLIALGLIMVGLAGLAMSHDRWLVMVFSLTFGAGVGAWFLARLSWITANCDDSERGRAIATMAGIQRFGTLVGPAAGTLLAGFAGFDMAFASACGLAVLGWVCVAWFVPGDSRALAAHTDARPSLRVVFAEHWRVLSVAGSAALGLQLARAARQLLTPLWGTALGLGPELIGAVFSAAALLDLSLFYAAGYVMDRYGRRATAVPCTVLVALSVGLLAFADGWFWFALVVALGGLGNGIGTGIIATIGSDLAPRHQRGEFIGAWRLIGDVGGSGGPFMIAGLMGLAGLAATTMVCAAIGLAGAAIFAFAFEETRRPIRA